MPSITIYFRFLRRASRGVSCVGVKAHPTLSRHTNMGPRLRGERSRAGMKRNKDIFEKNKTKKGSRNRAKWRNLRARWLVRAGCATKCRRRADTGGANTFKVRYNACATGCRCSPNARSGSKENAANWSALAAATWLPLPQRTSSPHPPPPKRKKCKEETER